MTGIVKQWRNFLVTWTRLPIASCSIRARKRAHLEDVSTTLSRKRSQPRSRESWSDRKASIHAYNKILKNSVGAMRPYILSRSRYLHTKTKLWVYISTVYIHTLLREPNPGYFYQHFFSDIGMCVCVQFQKKIAQTQDSMVGRIWTSTLSALSSRRHTCSRELPLR